MEIEGPGIVEAVARLETMRNKIGASEIAASFITTGGDVELIVAANGFEMYVNGQRVPVVKR
jgi:hypothetical protein